MTGVQTCALPISEGSSLTQALESASGCLREFGGHPGAAGFRLDRAQVPALEERLAAFYKE